MKIDNLTYDEIKRLNMADAAEYMKADEAEKGTLSARHRRQFQSTTNESSPETWSPGPKVTSTPVAQSSTLRLVGKIMLIVGALAVTILLIKTYGDPYADPPSLVLMIGAGGLLSTGFWCYLVGIIEERLLGIQASLNRR